MADKKYKLNFEMSDGTTQSVQFTVPQGDKGDKGDTGATGATGSAGKDGANGKDGTSVTVKSVSESTADGGNNVVTFSDGKTLTVKNGSKGSKGDSAPQESVLYTAQTLSEAQKAQARANIGVVGAVTPQDYGAKGNGSTDDTAAFQNALANNRIVFVPGGTYKLSGELIIGMNCQLELAQDAFLDFKQTSGNCISMRAGSNIIGNHATINVPYAFTGKAINIDAGLDSGIFGIPPLKTGKWGPMWAAARYITDLHIVKLNYGGVARSVDGKCSGTAVYLRASYQDTMNFLWAVDLNKLRIAGGFTYGIHLDSEINPADPMDGWIHQTKIDGFITGCEVAVYLKDSTLSYISVRIVPDWGADNNAVYCKHGIVLENSTNVDLSQSRVMDWDSKHTLWTEGGEYQHLKLLGNCAGLILSEHYYYDSPNNDIRSLIYTDRPSNLEKLVIIQEPITRWFKGIEGVPYFNNGFVEKKLLLQEEFEECFALERMPDFEDALSKAINKDGTPFNNGLGYYPYGKRWIGGSGALSDDATYYGCTGLIPIKAGDTLYTDQITWKNTDGNEGAVIFDSNFNRIQSCTGITVVNMTYFFGYTKTDEGFALTLKPINELSAAAYIAFTFERTQIGDNPLISVNVPMTFSQHGFLADSVEVKSEKVYGLENTVNRLINSALADAIDNVGKGIIYIAGDSTTAGTWTGTTDEITSYYDGLVIAYKINIAGVSGGTTLNINGLGAVPVKRNASTAVTTTYPVGAVVILTYSGGAWLTADYDANTKNSAGTSNKTGSKMYLVGATSQTSSGTTTYTNTNAYIGTDNCLYSGNSKVYTANDLTTIISSVIDALPVYNGEVV